jgi:hypothetical protein
MKNVRELKDRPLLHSVEDLESFCLLVIVLSKRIHQATTPRTNRTETERLDGLGAPMVWF